MKKTPVLQKPFPIKFTFKINQRIYIFCNPPPSLSIKFYLSCISFLYFSLNSVEQKLFSGKMFLSIKYQVSLTKGTSVVIVNINTMKTTFDLNFSTKLLNRINTHKH